MAYLFNIEIQPSAVTYDFSGGRFGDNLVAYAHAKWISYKFKIPLLYKPFPCSDKLAMHKKELFYENEKYKYKTNVRVNKECNIEKNIDVLYVVPYFPESDLELQDAQFAHAFSVDWSDKNFISILRECIGPIVSLNEFPIPKDHISVAVHVRRGTGYDIKHLDEFKIMACAYPLKFVADSYYIEQIKKIGELYKGKKIYVCIFTDHTYPYEIFEIYKRKVNDSNIMFNFKTNDNLHDQINILSDFFSLTKFDCLIRSDSNFTIMASKLANYKIEISPLDAFVKKECVVITRVKIKNGDVGSVIINTKIEKEKLEWERAEREKLECETAERERVERERIEREMAEHERAKREKIEQERAEQERIEKVAEQERVEQEKLKKERMIQIKLDNAKEKIEKEKQKKINSKKELLKNKKRRG